MDARETEEEEEEEEEEKEEEEEEEEKQMAPGAALLAHSSRWRREAVGSEIEDHRCAGAYRRRPWRFGARRRGGASATEVRNGEEECSMGSRMIFSQVA